MLNFFIVIILPTIIVLIFKLELVHSSRQGRCGCAATVGDLEKWKINISCYFF